MGLSILNKCLMGAKRQFKVFPSMLAISLILSLLGQCLDRLIASERLAEPFTEFSTKDGHHGSPVSERHSMMSCCDDNASVAGFDLTVLYFTLFAYCFLLVSPLIVSPLVYRFFPRFDLQCMLCRWLH
jgi:hypothetical protein